MEDSEMCNRWLSRPVVTSLLPVFVFLALVGSVGLLKSCGDGTPDNDVSKDRHPDNYEAWRDAWDGERWIVATKDSRPKEDALRLAFARAFAALLQARGASFQASSASIESSSVESFLPRAARMPLLFVNGVSLPQGDVCDVKRCPTFAFLRLPHSRVPWDALFPSGAPNPFDFSFAKTKDVMRLHWDTLNAMDGVLFAEPDLAAPSANVRNVAKPNAPKANTPKLLAEAPVQYPEYLNLIQLPQAEAAEKAKKYTLKDVVVAVLDTGVDRLHPALKDRMFQLPNRDPASPPAVFRQGDFEYFGDAFGIDASWEKNSPADAVAASPGSADIGGPGQPCPSVTTEDGRSADLRSSSGTDCSHGTHVAGIIAAAETPPALAGNPTEFTIRGVCRNCKIVSIRSASVDLKGPVPNNGKILDSSQIRGMQFVASLRADSSSLYVNVLNMSIGQYDDSRAMRTIIDSLRDSGIVLVAAASNNNTDRRAFPAAYQGVVAVCATSVERARGNYGKAIFSNFGEWVDICAPGENIFSTVPGGIIRAENGTSMAAPLVAGVAGYLMGIAESLGIPVVGRADAVIARMLTASNWGVLYSAETAPFNEPYQFKLPDGTGAEFLGRGFLDMENALTGARSVERTEVPKPQVERGCVASTIGQPNPHAMGDALTSVPLLLGAFALLLRLRKVWPWKVRLRKAMR